MALSVAILALTACDEDGITAPDRAPFMMGQVVGLNGCDFTQACIAVVPTSVETVWVKENQDDPCGVILSVDEKTDLLVRESSALRRAVPTDFTPFREAHVWVAGNVIAESCPAQGLLEAIELR